MAIENLINKGISTFLGGDDKGTGIDRFVSNFDTGARANRFQADFFGPMGLSLEGLRCDTASLPGRTIETTPWSEYGQKRQMPNAVNDGGETAFTFNCDQAFADRLIIEAWQSLVFTAGEGSQLQPTFAYYNDYIGQVDITQYRTDGGSALKYKLYECYPKTFDAMALDANTPDSILKFSCTMAYRGWEVEYTEPPALSGLNKGRRALNAVMEGLSVASRFGSKGDKLLGKLTKADTNLGKINNVFGNGN